MLLIDSCCRCTSADRVLDESPNCLAYELARCHEEPERYVLRIHWDSLEGHLQGFRKSPGFRDFLASIRGYIDDIEEMQHYVATDVRSQGDSDPFTS